MQVKKFENNINDGMMWKTMEGGIIHTSKMGTSHLFNSVKMIYNHICDIYIYICIFTSGLFIFSDIGKVVAALGAADPTLTKQDLSSLGVDSGKVRDAISELNFTPRQRNVAYDLVSPEREDFAVQANLRRDQESQQPSPSEMHQIA